MKFESRVLETIDVDSLIAGSISKRSSSGIGRLFAALEDFFLRVPTDIGGGGENSLLASDADVEVAPGTI